MREVVLNYGSSFAQNRLGLTYKGQSELCYIFQLNNTIEINSIARHNPSLINWIKATLNAPIGLYDSLVLPTTALAIEEIDSRYYISHRGLTEELVQETEVEWL